MSSTEEPTGSEPAIEAAAKSDPARAREGVPGWITVLIALPVLYVLSVGPVAGIATKYRLPDQPFKTIYAPLIWLHKHTALKEPLEWYVELWGGK